MWPNRRLIDLLQIEHPLILAPMTEFGTIELAASVSNSIAKLVIRKPRWCCCCTAFPPPRTCNRHKRVPLIRSAPPSGSRAFCEHLSHTSPQYQAGRRNRGEATLDDLAILHLGLAEAMQEKLNR